MCGWHCRWHCGWHCEHHAQLLWREAYQLEQMRALDPRFGTCDMYCGEQLICALAAAAPPDARIHTVDLDSADAHLSAAGERPPDAEHPRAEPPPAAGVFDERAPEELVLRQRSVECELVQVRAHEHRRRALAWTLDRFGHSHFERRRLREKIRVASS